MWPRRQREENTARGHAHLCVLLNTYNALDTLGIHCRVNMLYVTLTQKQSLLTAEQRSFSQRSYLKLWPDDDEAGPRLSPLNIWIQGQFLCGAVRKGWSYFHQLSVFVKGAMCHKCIRSGYYCFSGSVDVTRFHTLSQRGENSEIHLALFWCISLRSSDHRRIHLRGTGDCGVQIFHLSGNPKATLVLFCDCIDLLVSQTMQAIYLINAFM